MSDAPANGFFQLGTVVAKGHDDFPPSTGGLGWVPVEVGHKQPEVYWMRLVQTYASAEVGMAFYPEVGDQVLTVRIGGGEYLCLGSVYTGKTAAKFSNDEGGEYGKNFTKEFSTKGGHALTFYEEPDKEYVQLDVKAGKMLVKFDVGGKSITVDGTDATKTFTVNAPDAQLDATVKNATVKVGGAVIDIQSDAIDVKGASLTIKTDGAITVEAGAKVVIKGSAVEIC